MFYALSTGEVTPMDDSLTNTHQSIKTCSTAISRSVKLIIKVKNL